jgi:hypothetical protein
MRDAIIEVLGIVEDGMRNPTKTGGEVLGIVEDGMRNPTKTGVYDHKMETFNFVFIMKMILKVLCMTNDVFFLLQKKNQNIVEVCDE